MLYNNFYVTFGLDLFGKCMKRFKVLLFSFICVLALSGCVRYDATLKLKVNGKVDVSVCYAMLDMSDHELNEMLSEDQLNEYKEDGWDIEEYKDGGYSGYIVRKKDVPIKELRRTSDEFKSLKLTKKGIEYTLNWDILDDANEYNLASLYNSYVKMSGAQMRVKITLPAEALDDNATHVSRDGKTYEWDLLNFDDPDGIYLKFRLIDIKLVAAGVALLIALIVAEIAIFKAIKKRKKSKPSGKSSGKNLIGSLKALNPIGKSKKK